jgi:uroporphyrin-III C-methyltransferase / precorrin-2 dehydrogenase / sirohydrochlorin ferrochelatase
MGLSTVGILARTLIEAGWSCAIPVVIASCVSQSGERRIATTLDVLAHPVTKLDLRGPALLIIGEVAGMDAAGLVEHIEQSTPPAAAREVAHA